MTSKDAFLVSAAFVAECHGNMARLNPMLQRSGLSVERFELGLRALEQQGCLRRKLDFVVLVPENHGACLTCVADDLCPARPPRSGGGSGVFARRPAEDATQPVPAERQAR